MVEVHQAAVSRTEVAERIEREQAEEEERLVREAKERAEKKAAEQARAEEEMKLLREQGFLNILQQLQAEMAEMKNLMRASRAVSEQAADGDVVHQTDSPNA